MLASNAPVLPTRGSTLYVFAYLCVFIFCRAISFVTGSDPVLIVYCATRTFCLIQLTYLTSIVCHISICVPSCRAKNARFSLSLLTLLCLPTVSVPTRSADSFPLTSLIPWFKTPVVLPHFYASARNTAKTF